jgi:hypothetical protein
LPLSFQSSRHDFVFHYPLLVGLINQIPTFSFLCGLDESSPYKSNLGEGFDIEFKGADYELLNLGGPFVESVDSGIAVEAFHIVFS